MEAMIHAAPNHRVVESPIASATKPTVGAQQRVSTRRSDWSLASIAGTALGTLQPVEMLKVQSARFEE